MTKAKTAARKEKAKKTAKKTDKERCWAGKMPKRTTFCGNFWLHGSGELSFCFIDAENDVLSLGTESIVKGPMLIAKTAAGLKKYLKKYGECYGASMASYPLNVLTAEAKGKGKKAKV
jgi:hypothetical protein